MIDDFSTIVLTDRLARNDCSVLAPVLPEKLTNDKDHISPSGPTCTYPVIFWLFVNLTFID